ncbi:lysozyme [Ancylobacter amanitiformis]|uniref:Lysozyme n=1 Tax=Ancylobacter amanitiformis TaxID=217069 RepID=A0ABU0LQ73_9HYPH|nr:lysozyme [Ancylobacter amanitiformis]MDQ0510863.1 GH24 family phage-related lysozyme (muramidase) [Ancylobacter amanitiformis]
MPISKLRPSKRAAAAVAAVVAMSIGGYAIMPGTGERVPDDVVLAATYLVRPWEGRELRAYPDPATGGAPWTICDGDTKGVRPGMMETPAGCDKRLVRRMMEFRGKLVACIPGFGAKPLSWRAMMNGLTWNIGPEKPRGSCGSTAARLGIAGDYIGSCNAATAFNKAGGKVWAGLVNRREMGDASRIGEGELCVTGVQ